MQLLVSRCARVVQALALDFCLLLLQLPALLLLLPLPHPALPPPGVQQAVSWREKCCENQLFTEVGIIMISDSFFDDLA